MGTRSLTVVKSEDGKKEIIVMYRQYDGYPAGHGLELAEYLASFRVCNGFGEKVENLANGMGCLAGQIVAHFKIEVGQFYLYPSKSRDLGEEWIYTVSLKDGKLQIKVEECRFDVPPKKVFCGDQQEFLTYCNTWK